MNMREKIAKYRLRVAAIALMVIGYFMNVIYFLLNGINLINSDSSAEMILAGLLNRNKEWVITREWIYSSELRVLNTQLIYQLGLKVFPHDWHLARTLSVALFMLIMLAAAVYLVWAFHLGDEGLLVMSMLMFPFGSWYAWNIIYASFYVPHLAISLFSLGLLARTVELGEKGKDKRAHGMICLLLLLLLSFVSGFGGVRQMMVCYAPLGVAAFLLYVFRMLSGDEGMIKAITSASNERRGLVIAAFCGLFNALGYLVNLYILAGRYQFFNYSDTVFEEFSISRLLDTLSDYIELIGWEGGASILSTRGITCVVGLGMMILCWIGVISLLRGWKELSFPHKMLALFFYLAFALNWLVLSMSSQESNGSYWLPIFPFFVATAALSLKKHIERTGEKQRGTHKCFAVITMVIVLLMASHTVMNHPYGSFARNDLSIQPVVKWLAQNNYEKGAATFWNSDVVTELTSGEIEMWTAKADVDHFGEMYPWLQYASHMEEKPDGQFFILVSIEEYDKFFSPYPQVSSHIVYDDGEYRVLDYQGWKEFEENYGL